MIARMRRASPVLTCDSRIDPTTREYFRRNSVRSVLRAVVDKDDFDPIGCKRLGERRVEGVRDPILRVECRDDDAD